MSILFQVIIETSDDEGVITEESSLVTAPDFYSVCRSYESHMLDEGMEVISIRKHGHIVRSINEYEPIN